MEPKKNFRVKQISKIWAISKSLGINSEYLHVLVWGMTGIDSISKLSDLQLKKVVAHLVSEQEKQNKINQKLESNIKVFQLPTPAQKIKLGYLQRDAARILNLRDSNAYINSICSKMFDKKIHKLDRKEFGSLIKQLIIITKKTKIAK